MTPKTKVSAVGQWALGTVACLLLLLFSSNSFFEVSSTPKNDANCSFSLPGTNREQGGPCHVQRAVFGIEGKVCQPDPLMACRCLDPGAVGLTGHYGLGGGERDIFLLECPSRPLAGAVGTSVSGNHRALGTEPDPSWQPRDCGSGPRNCIPQWGSWLSPFPTMHLPHNQSFPSQAH